MTTYEAQTLETAPERSRDAMQRLKNSAGMVPNLAARMSTSPTLIEAFVTLREIVQAGTLDAKERETLGLPTPSRTAANGASLSIPSSPSSSAWRRLRSSNCGRARNRLTPG